MGFFDALNPFRDLLGGDLMNPEAPDVWTEIANRQDRRLGGRTDTRSAYQRHYRPHRGHEQLPAHPLARQLTPAQLEIERAAARKLDLAHAANEKLAELGQEPALWVFPGMERARRAARRRNRAARRARRA